MVSCVLSCPIGSAAGAEPTAPNDFLSDQSWRYSGRTIRFFATLNSVVSVISLSVWPMPVGSDLASGSVV